MLIGTAFGFLPVLPGWIFGLAGLLLYRTTQPDDWRVHPWVDKRLPNKIRHRLYRDLRRQDKAKKHTTSAK